jgi:hypothetical protein
VRLDLRPPWSPGRIRTTPDHLFRRKRLIAFFYAVIRDILLAIGHQIICGHVAQEPFPLFLSRAERIYTTICCVLSTSPKTSTVLVVTAKTYPHSHWKVSTSGLEFGLFGKSALCPLTDFFRQ